MGVPQRFGCERARLTSGQQFRATSGVLQHLRCAGKSWLARFEKCWGVIQRCKSWARPPANGVGDFHLRRRGREKGARSDLVADARNRCFCTVDLRSSESAAKVSGDGRRYRVLWRLRTISRWI